MGDDTEVTREEFDALAAEVAEMSDNINRFVKHTAEYMQKMDVYQGNLVNALTNTTPAGHLPIESHRQVVRGIIVSFSVILVVAIGATKVAPIFSGLLH